MSESIVDRLNSALEGRYRIERELGRGGAATVYLAHDLKHDRSVAVKVMRPELAATLGPERFLRETRTAAQLSHPHIVPVYDSGEAAGLLYYVMPYVEGESLRVRLRREQRLPIEEALQITRDVGSALSFAHSRGLVHRDVKPENIMVSGSRAVLADFGIARAMGDTDTARLTETGLTVGTPIYMSPEQAAGVTVDGRSDIYSLGCVLYEMLGGDPPFTASTPQALIARKLTERVPSLITVRESVPSALEEVVNKALARDKADRYVTAERFVEAVSRAVTEEASGRAAGRHPGAEGHRTSVGPARDGRIATWLRQRWWVALPASALVIGITFLGPWGSGADVDRQRVVVGFIRNETGDAGLDGVGGMAAQSITEGLVRTGVIDAVPPLSAQHAVRVISASLEDGRVVDPATALGEMTSAGLVVSGSYFRQGDELVFHLQVTDVARDAVLVALEPVAGASDTPSGVVEELRQRVAGVLALLFDERVVLPTGMALHAPPYDAYREFSRGLEAYRRYEIAEALRSFVRAGDADPDFVLSSLFAAMCAVEEGGGADPSVLDSLVMDLERRSRLTEYEREWVAYFRAQISGDTEVAYRAMQRAAAMAPGSRAELWFGRAALEFNRPAEALRVFEGLDPESEPLRGWLPYWIFKTRALHLLGDHTRELAAAREARRMHPDDIAALQLEATALAALGEAADVERLFDEAEALVPMTDEVQGSVARRHPDLLRIVGEELRAHGNREAGLAAFQRALRWYDRFGDLVASAETDEAMEGAARWGDIYWRGVLLYNAERPLEALQFLEALLANQLAVADTAAPGAAERMVAMGVQWTYSNIGVAAALAGDTVRAEDALRQLELILGPSRQVGLRTRVIARLGRREEAVRLMNEVLRNGDRANVWFHAAIDYAPLHGYPGFEAILRPRG